MCRKLNRKENTTCLFILFFITYRQCCRFSFNMVINASVFYICTKLNFCLFLYISGVRTVQHFNRPEDPNRFVNTDLYRRQNANRYGTVHQKYGRPGEGYYLMRNPSKFIDLFNLSSLLKCSNIREII